MENYVKVATIDDLNIPRHVEKIIEHHLPSVEEAQAGLKSAWNESLDAAEKPPKNLQ